MTTPTPPRQTTRVMQAVTASHGRWDTAPRYVVGGVLLVFALGMFGLHALRPGVVPLGTFEQRFIGGCAVAGLGILPPAEALLRFAVGAISAWKSYKNPQGPTP